MPKASIVFDLRFLDNPYWEPGMRTMSGLDKKVFDYVMSVPGAEEFYQDFKKTTDFILPLAKKKEDKGGDIESIITIAFGCTGGQHRSVVFARRLGSDLKKSGYQVEIQHRDLEKSLQKEIERVKQEEREA